MKAFFAALLFCTALPTQAHDVTLGIQAGFPESAGLHFSYWPLPTLTLDAQLTLASADAGLVAHFPAGPVDILAGAMGGYSTHWLAYEPVAGGHFQLLAGLGYRGERWEIRGLGGVNFAPGTAWAAGGVGEVMVGLLL